MNVPDALTALYPPAVRQRWGDELTCEVRESGPKSWVDTVMGAARLWLHPRDWPELVVGHTCAVLTCALAAVTAAAALLVRAAEPSRYLTGDPARPATSAWLVLVFVGVVLAAPRPRLDLQGVRRLAAMAVRELTAPAFLAVVLWLIANSTVASHPTGPARVGFIAFYWISLAFGAFRLCRLIARIVAISRPPSRRRMYAALPLLGSGLGLAAVQSQLGTTHAVSQTAIGLALAALAAAVVTAARNFRPAS